ncbi:MAG: putative toxin-antitoxin system toxin component, PIN family [Candidatus Omnitrophica bacterium]|nr:putative toxin-antitoxin system toxin component, PIN family [Candidatus Omnitrophota bacterium]
MRPRVVLDTSVVISGLLFGGPPGLLLDLGLEGAIEVATSSNLMNELERVLHEKFPHAQQAIWDTVATLKEIAVSTIPQESVTAISVDPSDNRVLECALSAHADAIVSGDKHLLALKLFRGMPILAPQAFLAQWRLKKP